MRIRIQKLIDNQTCFTFVVNWLYSEWGNNNYHFWVAWIRSSTRPEGIPQTFVSYVDDVIAGTYILWRCNLQSRQDLFPWFGSLYYDRNFRGKLYVGRKLGQILLIHSNDQLKQLGYPQAYLSTDKSIDCCIRDRWKYIGIASNEKGRPGKLCVLNIK